jgi:hypothetical protein
MTALRLTPTLRVLGRTVSAFHLCGIVGWVSGISLALLLTAHQGLPLRVTGVLALGSILTFLALARAVKVATGEEYIVYYHHEIAVVAVSALILWRLDRPVLPYLDAVFMGLGLFLACGRIGCLMVGCCHGQPHAWGVCYGGAHAAAGFASHLVGVRLFPIQLVEALIVAATVTLGTILLLRGAAPGTALALYSVVYGSARFGLEFLRGDAARPYWRGVSEAQWTSFAIMVAVLGLSGLGPVPFAEWWLAATLAMGVVLLACVAADTPLRRQFRPRHVDEIAGLLAAAHASARAAGELQIGRTSLGLRISASLLRDGPHWLDVFAFSEESGPLDERTARRLARLVSRLRRAGAEGELRRGGHGVYHVILPATTPGREPGHVVPLAGR